MPSTSDLSRRCSKALHKSRLQPLLLTTLTNCPLFLLHFHPSPLLLLSAFHFNIPHKEPALVPKAAITLKTDETRLMPLAPQRFDRHLIQDLILTSPAPRARPPGVTPHAIGVAIPLHKWRVRIKRITALATKEMSNMPLCPSSYDDFAFYGRLAALTARAEELVEVEMAEESDVSV